MKHTKRLHVPDVHAPNHNARAFNLMLEVAKDFKPDEVVIYGDFFDAYSVSFHSKNPLKTYQTIEHELEDSRPVLYKLAQTVPRAKLVFLCGNHELRIQRYLRAYAPMLSRSVNLEDLLKLPRGTRFYPYGKKNRHFMGKLMATHGTLYNKHVAHSMLAKYGCSISFGHTHRSQEYNSINVHGDRLKAITFGWLGDIEQAGEYIDDVADWVTAFGISYHFPNGDFTWQTIEIQNNRLVFNGDIYK